MTAVMIYVTTKDKAEAQRVGKVLVESRLVACVNIIEGMQSMFWWKGSAQSEQECVLIAKTRVGLVSDINEKIKSVHTYECPCIVAIPIIDGNPEFLQWIQEETSQAQRQETEGS